MTRLVVLPTVAACGFLAALFALSWLGAHPPPPARPAFWVTDLPETALTAQAAWATPKPERDCSVCRGRAADTLCRARGCA
jgi:hypothetical protein